MISIEILAIIQKKIHRCKSNIQELIAEKNKTLKGKNQREKINGEV